MRYEDFELKIDREEDGRYRVSCRSQAGDVTHADSIAADPALLHAPPLLAARLDRGGATRDLRVPDEDARIAETDVGRRLFDTFVVGEVRTKYREALAAATARGAGLRFSVRIDPRKAREVERARWESLADEAGPLACNVRTPIVRIPEMDVGIDVGRDRRRARLRVLVILASPTGLAPQLDLRKERASATRAMRWAKWLGAISWRVLENPNIDDIRAAFDEEEWDVLHFAGHGGHDESGAFLAIECGSGEECEEGYRKLRAEEISMLAKNESRLVLAFFNCCHGADIGPSPAPSLAEQMLRDKVLAVVAMQGPISDESANRFAEAMYGAVASGRPLEEAITSAREALVLPRVRERAEWDVPVLYLRKDIALRVPWGIHLRAFMAFVALTLAIVFGLIGYSKTRDPLSFEVLVVNDDGKLAAPRKARVVVARGAQKETIELEGRSMVTTGMRVRNADEVTVEVAGYTTHRGAIEMGDLVVMCRACLIDPDEEVTMLLDPWREDSGTWSVEARKSGEAIVDKSRKASVEARKVAFGGAAHVDLEIYVEPKVAEGEEVVKQYAWRLQQPGGQERCRSTPKPDAYDAVVVGSRKACEAAREAACRDRKCRPLAGN